MRVKSADTARPRNGPSPRSVAPLVNRARSRPSPRSAAPGVARVLSLATLVLLSACASLPERPATGVAYVRFALRLPRPVVIHVIKIDLDAADAELSVRVAPDVDGDGSGDSSLVDPLSLGWSPGAMALVNANAFVRPNGSVGAPYATGEPVVVLGWAIENGTTRSRGDAKSYAAWSDRSGTVAIGEARMLPEGEAVAAAAGFSMLVDDGIAVETDDRPERASEPRSGIGVSKDGRTVWLAVADGRRPGYSEGLTLGEWASVFASLGAWDALNLDGGGSSLLATATETGKPVVANAPSDFPLLPLFRRPVPVVIVVRRGK